MSSAATPTIRVLTANASETRLYSLEEGRVGIGRGADNAVVLQDNLVSRQHAQLEYDGEMVYLYDIGGKNPVRVNGEPISGPRELADGDLIAIGELTIKDVTKSVEIALEYLGTGTDPWGGSRVGFEGSTTISRKEWGIDFNIPLEGDKLMIGDKVNVVLAVEAVLQADEAPQT